MSPELPTPFDTGSWGAHMEHRRRTISVTLHVPEGDTLHRCGFVWAWASVVETAPWSNECRAYGAERRVTDPSPRMPFTDAAREAIARDIVGPINRYGFDRWWSDLRRPAEGAGMAGVKRARDRLTWWTELAELLDAERLGLVTLRPIGRDLERRTPTVLVDEHRGPHRVEVVATAHVDGEHVGWMTERGGLVPLDDVLARPRSAA